VTIPSFLYFMRSYATIVGFCSQPVDALVDCFEVFEKLIVVMELLDRMHYLGKSDTLCLHLRILYI
jgi:hypothetical protein